MKEYYITYISLEDGEIYTGCGHGFGPREAIKEFLSYYQSAKILSVKLNH